MKKKKWIPLIFCSILLIALLFIYMALQKHNAKVEEMENAEAGVKVLDMDSTDIISVGFELEGEKVVFSLDEDNWKLESDESFDVNKSAVDELIADITEMTSDRVLTDVTELSEYGLEQPVQTLVLTDKEGNTETVYWGASNALTADDYLYVEGKNDTVYTVNSDVLQALSGTLEDFRDNIEDSSQEDTTKEES